MEDEYGKTLDAIQFAIQMEIDGKEYYQKASRESGNKMGRELFEWLAAEEDKHRRRFEDIYNVIKKQKAWPEVDIEPRKGDILNTLFSEAMRAADPNVKAVSTELDAIAKAMEMETKTHDFYKSQGEEAVYDAERKLYTSLAAEERGHYLALVDYREYLVDPAGWFRKAEHHSLDGG
ncbi:MAG: ferritin family protein [Dehalococcoidia bacterium]|nr:ferritin family protein [Dehalococcoidia bacterium]